MIKLDSEQKMYLDKNTNNNSKFNKPRTNVLGVGKDNYVCYLGVMYILLKPLYWLVIKELIFADKAKKEPNKTKIVLT